VSASRTPRTIDLGAYDPTLAGVRVTGNRLVQDSRAVEPGDVFVAIGSTGASGLAFIDDALARGAAAVLYEAPARVDVTGAHGIHGLGGMLGRIADDFTGHPSRDLTLVGVTGTNGKTSIVQLVSQAWHALGMSGASIGTLGAGPYGTPPSNTGLTTPPVTSVHELLAEFRDAGVENVAIEVSSHALEQHRVAGALFDIVVFTNVTRDHLDYHGTMERYAAAKAMIFDLPGTTGVVINVDDEYGARFFAERAGQSGVVGVSSRANPAALVRAHDVVLTPGGIDFTLSVDGSEHPITTSLIGRFNVDNLLACAGVLYAQGIPAEQIAHVLGRLEPVFGRMNRIQPDPSLPLVVVDYAHTPDAISQSLAALAQYGHDRIITVFGCTGDRDRGKRPDMARIVESASDLVVVTDDDVHHENGDRILDDIRAGFENPDAVVELRDRAAAIEYAISHAGAGDVVLIAGKGHEDYQVVGDERVPFSDTRVAERILRARLP
jgi:UDP-N-acetylmuramoyl-L-alanyl-D-glutamate--2,6-diaminopimelate ligase